MNKLLEQVNKLEAHIAKQEVINSTVSKASVGWHLEHSLLAINSIISNVKNSNPKDYKREFNFWRIVIFARNKIPRGRGKAPKKVQPQENITFVRLSENVEITKQKLKELHNLKPNNYFEHPNFGKLNTKKAIKFLDMHTQHHLDIIEDILKEK